MSTAKQRAALAEEPPPPPEAKVGPDPGQDADADERLAADAGITVDSLRWRAAYRERQIGREMQRYELAEVVAAETPQRDTRGKAKAILPSYLEGVSRLLAPSRAYDSGFGPAAIGSDAHVDRLDLEVWLAAQSDATRRLAYLIVVVPDDKELPGTWGGSRRSLARWAARLAEAADAEASFTPPPQRKRRA